SFLLMLYITTALRYDLFGEHIMKEFSIVICVMCVLVMYILVKNTVVVKQNEMFRCENDVYRKYIQLQKKYVSRIVKNSNQLRKFKHDYRSHMLVLQNYYTEGEYKSMGLYLERILGNSGLETKGIYTGNMVADVIVNEYRVLAEERGVEYSWKGVIPKILVISDYELCVLLSNIIKNALEAAIKVKKQRKFINIQMVTFGKHIEITIENSSIGQLKVGSDGMLKTTKDDHDNHGQGYVSIKEIVNRYEGKLNHSFESGCFRLEIII
ncbi:MAG: ATP-binding protein, partial [Eubacterium sp.]|nr:ATP-binding protein [Eubacterium sp.]